MATQQEDRHVPGLRVISFVPDVKALDIYANGELLYEGVGQVDPHVDALPLPKPDQVTEETSVEIAAVPAGEPLQKAHVLATTTIETGGWEGMAKYGYSVFVIGEECAISNHEVELVVVEDDHSKTREHHARFRAGHASPDMPAVDIKIEGEAGTTLLENGEFGETGMARIPAGEGVIAVVEAESGSPIARWEIKPREGHIYTGWIVGYQHLDSAPSDVSEKWKLGMAISDDSKPGVE